MIYVYSSAFDPITYAHINIIKTIQKIRKVNDEFYIAINNNDETLYHTTLQERFDIVHSTLLSKYKNHSPIIMEQHNQTLYFLKEQFSGQDKDICLVVGEDEWNSLINGKVFKSELLLKQYQFLVINRTGHEKEKDGNEIVHNLPKNITVKATFIEAENCEGISSSLVRDILYSNPNIHYDSVSKYITHQTFRAIKENRLYKQNDFDYEKEEKEYLNNHLDDLKKSGWNNPSITADIVAYNGSKILLIRRGDYPYKNMWALPGGFMKDSDETLEYTAAREFAEETSLEYNYNNFYQIKTYSKKLDPRIRVINTAFSIRISARDMDKVIGLDDAIEAKWFDIEELPPLAFNHLEIITDWRNKNE